MMVGGVRLTIGGLFSGIGGFELGLSWAGLGDVVWHAEIDPFCRRVLEKNFPGVPCHGDVSKLTSSDLVPVDVLCGGFPCQGISRAGKGLGFSDPRSSLWFEQLRLIRELGPSVVLIENVSSGKIRWLKEVGDALETHGYAQTSIDLRAVDVGAPHLRARTFVVGLADRGEGREVEAAVEPGDAFGRGRQALSASRLAGGVLRLRQGGAYLQHALDEALRETLLAQIERAKGWGQASADEPQTDEACGEPVRQLDRASHGLPSGLDVSLWRSWPSWRGEAPHPWEPPRAVSKEVDRKSRLGALGNAIVPQCAEVVGRFVRRLLEP